MILYIIECFLPVKKTFDFIVMKMKFLQCVTTSNSKRSSRKHHKSSRRRRRNSRSSYVSPSSITRRLHSNQTDYTSGIGIQNRNAFHSLINDRHNAIDVNPVNYIEMGVPPTIFEHQVYSNNHNNYASQKFNCNMNPLLKMNSKVYPNNSGGYPSEMNQIGVRGNNNLYSGIEKKRRRKVSRFVVEFYSFPCCLQLSGIVAKACRSLCNSITPTFIQRIKKLFSARLFVTMRG